jgi:protein involved in polysaccharide export with SLBB domain
MVRHTALNALAALAVLLGGTAGAFGQAGSPQGGPTAAPAVTAAAASDRRENYRIGPGDILDIRVLGEEQMSQSGVKVSETGFIRSPFVDDDIQALCKTERELSAIIAEKLSKYLKYPEVFVSVKEYNSTPVAIIGAVNSPARFQMQRRVRLIELLTHAGGVKAEAGKTLTLIHLYEGDRCDGTSHDGDQIGTTTETINIARLMQGDAREDRVMRSGDVVVVAVADQVFVAGEVLKPNAYPLREGMTLTQALALAGGPSGVAKTSAIRIVRTEPGKERVEITVDLKAIQSNKAPDPLLMANDLIEVPDSSGKKIWRGFIGAIGGGASQLPLRVIP